MRSVDVISGAVEQREHDGETTRRCRMRKRNQLCLKAIGNLMQRREDDELLAYVGGIATLEPLCDDD